MSKIQRQHSVSIKKRFLEAVKFITINQAPEKKEIDIIKALKMTPPNYYRMKREPEGSFPTLEDCYNLCNTFHISESWLISGVGPIIKNIANDSTIEKLKKLINQLEIELKDLNNK